MPVASVAVILPAGYGSLVGEVDGQGRPWCALILWAPLWKHGPRAAHPGLDSFPTSHTKGSAPLVVLEVPMLPIELFSSPMITQAAVFQGYYSKGPAGQTVH